MRFVSGGSRCRGSHLIKVFVRANSASKLARLSTLMKLAPTMQFVGASLDEEGNVSQLAELYPDVLLEWTTLDYSEEALLSEFNAGGVPRVIIVGVSDFTAAAAAMREPESNIRGILPAYASDAEIQYAIEAAAAGLQVFHPDVLDHVMEAVAKGTSVIPQQDSNEFRDSADQPLSPRENEVLGLLAQGLANKEIAWRLKISEHTVKFHITSIFNKLNASTRTEAVAIGIRQGLISL